MSKKILIDSELKNRLKDAEELISNFLFDTNDEEFLYKALNLIDDAINDIESTEDVKSNRYSILEWHHPTPVEENGKMFWLDIPEMELCGDAEQVLVKDKRGITRAVSVDFCEYEDDSGEYLSGVFPDGEDWSEYIAWAYLPE